MKKLNNKTLIIILVVLVGIFAVVRIFRTPAQRSNLKKELVSVDTASVTQIKVTPKSEGSELIFTREGKNWTLKKGEKTYNLEQSSVKGMLGQLVKLAPQKMVSRKKEKWNDYQVGDSSTRVQLIAGSETVADLKIGRIGFNQNPAQMQQQQYGGGGFGGGFTYVRVADEDEVYTVDGFLESSFNRGLNDWRNKTLIRMESDAITKISFNYPDSGFVAEKRDKKWWIGSMATDSTKIKAYLNQLGFKNASIFADDFVPNRQADLNLVVQGATSTLATLQAWKRENDWVFASSQQPNVYFSSEGSGLFQTLFAKQKDLVEAKK
jgi:hypothetical protein